MPAGVPSTAPAVTAIVLAGGRSERFGRDKLREPFRGRPLIAHAIEAVASVASDVVVAIAADASFDTDELGFGVRLVRDPEPDLGPLVGLRAALEVATEPFALVVAGDMPRLAPDVLGLLLRTLVEADPLAVDGTALVLRGTLQPLPVALRTGTATVAASRAVGDGERSLRGFLRGLRIEAIDEAAWRPLDPRADTLLDVDREADLRRLG